ncbi:MAG: FHIPEP family type III secretion protein [Candidatus Xenobiia bacterium LiM19]
MPGYIDIFDAIEHNDIEAVQHFLNTGLNISEANMHGFTPLHWAAKKGEPSVADFLIKSGAEIDVHDRDQMTPLHWAARRGHHALARTLLSHSADCECRDTLGRTPLHYAALQGHTLVAELLISSGASLRCTTVSGRTPLHEAASYGQSETVRLLLAKGASPEEMESDFQATPLHFAAREGHLQVSRILIENGASVAATDRMGKTPAHWALLSGKKELYDFLASQGVNISEIERTLLEITRTKGEALLQHRTHAKRVLQEVISSDEIGFLIASLPPEVAAAVFRYLSPDSVTKVAGIIASLRNPEKEERSSSFRKFAQYAGLAVLPGEDVFTLLTREIKKDPQKYAPLIDVILSEKTSSGAAIQPFGDNDMLLPPAKGNPFQSLTGEYDIPQSRFVENRKGLTPERPSNVNEGRPVQRQEDLNAAGGREHQKKKGTPLSILPLIEINPIIVEVGRSLLPLVDPGKGAPLLERIRALRSQMVIELGIVLPGVRFRDNLALPLEGYSIKIREHLIASGEVRVGRYLALAPPDVLSRMKGECVTDPVYGMKALWIGSAERAEAEKNGMVLFEPISVISMHITEIVYSRADELIGVQEVQAMLDNMKKSHPAVIKELIKSSFPIISLTEILKSLLRDKVSIRDLVRILEAILKSLIVTSDCDLIEESVRKSMSTYLCKALANRRNQIPAIVLTRSLERKLIRTARSRRAALRRAERIPLLQRIKRALQELFSGRSSSGTKYRGTKRVITNLSGDMMREIEMTLDMALEKAGDMNTKPVLICHRAIRAPLSRALSRKFPAMTVLSRDEVEDDFEVVPFFTIDRKRQITGIFDEEQAEYFILGQTTGIPLYDRPPLHVVSIVLLSLPPNLASKVNSHLASENSEKIQKFISELPRVPDKERLFCIYSFLVRWGGRRCTPQNCLEVLDEMADRYPEACARFMQGLLR